MAGTIHTIMGAIIVSSTMMLLAAATVQAQLLSPGELSASHAQLEGVTKCTSCHTIGGKGVDEAKCLDCHSPIRSRIEAEKGYHSTVSDPCVTCHKDHLGRNFSLVLLDTASFDHRQTGYALEGAHARTDCSSCHRDDLIADADILQAADDRESPGRTFLGLDSACSSCHAGDSPHDGQFEKRSCSDCHASEKWTVAEGFRHDQAAFVLTGRHTDVACQNCHPSKTSSDEKKHTRFVGLSYAECNACHRDPHGSSFGSACSSCHSTDGWSKLISERSFSHAKTGYPLLGAHLRLSCRSCHQRPARGDGTIRMTFVNARSTQVFPKIEASTCRSCHVDFHAGSSRDEVSSVSCEVCHTNTSWVPTSFGIDRHNQQSRFTLSGAHLSVPCGSCHPKTEEKPTFLFQDLQCVTCHVADNPHGTQFDARMAENSCASCHSTDAWNRDVNFDHRTTGFHLSGGHAHLACTRCHVPKGDVSTSYGIDYTGLTAACASCHAGRDPHWGQFGEKDCGACHVSTAFVPVSQKFDHGSTRFPLDGAHRKIPCSACHEKALAPDSTLFTRYLLEKTQCVDCHSSE